MKSIWDEIIEESRKISERQDGTVIRELKPGELCPKCSRAVLEYNRLLWITCPKCGFESGGSFT